MDELEEKSAQNELSLKTLKEFYAKVQKLNGDKLPKLPDINNNANANDLLLHPNDNGLFGNQQQQQQHQNDINLLERIKDNHKNLLNKIQNNNNNNINNRLTSPIDKRYLKQCEFYNEKKNDASASSSTSSSSQIDVSRLKRFKILIRTRVHFVWSCSSHVLVHRDPSVTLLRPSTFLDNFLSRDRLKPFFICDIMTDGGW